MNQNSTLYIGTYTKGSSEGIYIFDFNSKEQSCELQQVITTESPSYLALSQDKNILYAVNETANPEGDSLSTFQLKEGEWKTVSVLATKGIDPCYVSIANNGQHLFTANYSNGSLSVFSLNEEGITTDLKQHIQFTGTGPNTQRQEASHIHCTHFSPDGKYLFVSDLGADQLHSYKYDAANNSPLVLHETITIKAGAGPRHIVFNKEGTVAYLILELDATINVYSHDEGRLNLLQTISLESDAFVGENCAADIHLSNDEQFLYASNRGTSNAITVFAVSADSGKLSFVARDSCGGAGPRNFLITPCDHYLLVANQYTHDIHLFDRNTKTGKLTHLKKLLTIDSPVCLKM